MRRLRSFAVSAAQDDEMIRAALAGGPKCFQWLARRRGGSGAGTLALLRIEVIASAASGLTIA